MKFIFVFDIKHFGNKKIFKNFSDYFCKSSFIAKELAFELDIFSSRSGGFVFLIKSLPRCISNKFFFYKYCAMAI